MEMFEVKDEHGDTISANELSPIRVHSDLAQSLFEASLANALMDHMHGMTLNERKSFYRNNFHVFEKIQKNLEDAAK